MLQHIGVPVRLCDGDQGLIGHMGGTRPWRSNCASRGKKGDPSPGVHTHRPKPSQTPSSTQPPQTPWGCILQHHLWGDHAAESSPTPVTLVKKPALGESRDRASGRGGVGGCLRPLPVVPDRPYSGSEECLAPPSALPSPGAKQQSQLETSSRGISKNQASL